MSFFPNFFFVCFFSFRFGVVEFSCYNENIKWNFNKRKVNIFMSIVMEKSVNLSKQPSG